MEELKIKVAPAGLSGIDYSNLPDLPKDAQMQR